MARKVEISAEELKRVGTILTTKNNTTEALRTLAKFNTRVKSKEREELERQKLDELAIERLNKLESISDTAVNFNYGFVEDKLDELIRVFTDTEKRDEALADISKLEFSVDESKMIVDYMIAASFKDLKYFDMLIEESMKADSPRAYQIIAKRRDIISSLINLYSFRNKLAEKGSGNKSELVNKCLVICNDIMDKHENTANIGLIKSEIMFKFSELIS